MRTPADAGSPHARRSGVYGPTHKIKEEIALPANVESMMYYGEVPWHKQGTAVQEAPNADAALILAGLDWRVKSQKIYTEDGREVPGYRANRRQSADPDKDGTLLGLVTEKYRIVQNDEAFTWVDALMGEGARYETAGSLDNGKRIWLMVRLPEEYKILGDPTNTFLTFTNGHDGRHGVQAVISPVRVVCQNTLALAIDRARRSWSLIHSHNIHDRMEEARNALQLVDGYMKKMDAFAETMRKLTMTPQEWTEITEKVVPKTDHETPQTTLIRSMVDTAMYREDQEDFRYTGWGAINAVSWVTSHTQPTGRQNPDKPMKDFLDGDQMMRRLMGLLRPDIPQDMEDVIEI